jgi:hypothetical protein
MLTLIVQWLVYVLVSILAFMALQIIVAARDDLHDDE